MEDNAIEPQAEDAREIQIRVIFDVVTTLNELAMDISHSNSDRKRALTAAENCEKILLSLRRTQRQKMRAALTPPKGVAVDDTV